MFHYFYSATINESEEKFKRAFCCFLAIKNIIPTSSSSTFSVKLICWGMFVCLHKSIQWVYNNWWSEKSNTLDVV